MLGFDLYVWSGVAYLLGGIASEGIWIWLTKSGCTFWQTYPMSIVISYCLYKAFSILPVTQAYPVWIVGGLIGALVVGLVFVGEAISPWKAALLGLIILLVGFYLTLD